MNKLTRLAQLHKCDKCHKSHIYTGIYYQEFKRLRKQPIHLLELGVAKGASIKMWLDFFTKATIYGIDKHMIHDVIDPRFIFIEGRTSSRQLYKKLFRQCKEFDVIVDDCSHYFTQMKISFKYLWPRLVSGGIYVIEDMHCGHAGQPAIDHFSKWGEMKTDKLMIMRKP